MGGAWEAGERVEGKGKDRVGKRKEEGGRGEEERGQGHRVHPGTSRKGAAVARRCGWPPSPLLPQQEVACRSEFAETQL